MNNARKAIGMFKDEYLLDFINVEEIEVDKPDDVDERVVEQAIVRKPHENPTIGIVQIRRLWNM